MHNNYRNYQFSLLRNVQLLNPYFIRLVILNMEYCYYIKNYSVKIKYIHFVQNKLEIRKKLQDT